MGFEGIPKIEKTRKEQLKTEFGSLRKDWMEKKGINPELLTYSELKEQITKFYEENKDLINETLETKEETLEGDLMTVSSKKMDYNRVSKIREYLDLPKWTSLSETVAFIKTIFDYDDSAIKEKYIEYCAKGISLDDMKNVLAYENDVKPARLDTDIYHQSPQRSRAAVEIVSNAIDAMQPANKSIGRFGVGFYQILSHLNNEDDRVTVETGNKENGFYAIEFRLKNKEIEFNLKEIDSDRDPGTKVSLLAKDFPLEEAEKLVKKHFSYNNVAQVVCNGESVNKIKSEKNKSVDVEINKTGFTVIDKGVGMSPQVILEKLIVPKISGKQPITELIKEQNIKPEYFVENFKEGETGEGKVVINVGGVLIEEITLTGSKTVKTLVLEMPSFTLLGEERNAIAVDEVTVKASKELIEQAVSSGDVSVLNSLAPAIKKLQERSRLYEKKDNLITFFQEKTKELFKDSTESFLPNTQEFERVALPNITLLDPLLKQTAWKTIPGMEMPNLKGSGSVLYVAPLNYKNETDPLIVTGKNRAIVDKKIYESLKSDPTLINLYLNSFSKGKDVEIRQLMSYEPDKENTAIDGGEKFKEYKDLDDFITQEWVRLDAFDLFSIQKKIDFPLSVEHLARKKEIEEKIINKFPPAISCKFVNWFLVNAYQFSKDKINNLSSLAQNPELLNVFAELDICPFDRAHYSTREKTELNLFPGISKPHNSDEYEQSNVGLGWYKISYYGEEILISGTGKMFRGKFVFNDDKKRIAFYDQSDRSDKKLRFINTETGDFDKTEILFEEFSGRFGKQISFIDINGEECVGLSKQRVNVPDFDHRDPNDNRRSDEICFFRVSDGKPVSVTSDKGITLTGIQDGYRYGVSVKTIECEKHNPAYSPRSYYGYNRGRDYSRPLSVIDGIINPETGKMSNNDSEEESIANDIILKKFPTQYNYEVTSRIKAIFDRDTQSVSLFFDGNLINEFNANVSKNPEETCKNKHGGVNVGFDTFGQLDSEGVLINNTRNKKVEYFYQRNPWDQKEKTTGQVYWREDKIINSKGEHVYTGEWNEKLEKITGYNGEEFFISSKFLEDNKIEGEKSIGGYPKEVAGKFYILNTEGKIVTGDELKKIPPVDFRIDYGKYGTRCHVTPYESDFFKIQSDAYGITLINKETNEKLVDRRFSDVVYHTDKNLWECRVLAGKEDLNETIFLNDKGVVVEEGLIRSGKHFHADEFEKTSFLSKEKTVIMQKVIEAYEDQDVNRIKLLLERTFKFNELSDDAYNNFASIMLRINYLNPNLINNDLINSLEKRIEKYDLDNKVFFYEFLSRFISVKEKDVLKEDGVFLEKYIKIFNEKIAILPLTEKEEIFDIMSQTRNYRDEYLVTGWSIVQNKTAVSTELIPEKIRPLIEYLRTDEKESMSTSEKPSIEMNNKNPQFTLSQLIQTKRLNETAISQFSGSIENLIEIIDTKTAGKHQEHIRREIIHPIYYQSVNNPYLFIRELVQNAHDALVESKESNKSVSVDLLSRSEETLTVRIEDPVGMSKETLINYFLVPGETTKKDKKEQIGYFGQGLFTLFRESKEVLVKTGIGNGFVTKMKITPRYDSDGALSDLDIVLEEEESDYKGTTIEKTINTKYPQVEAAYIKNATCSFTSLVDANIININLNDAQINKPQDILSRIEVSGLGEVRIYEAPNNVITQRGLFVKSIDEDYGSGMSDVENLLKKRGYVLQIPDGLDLTRSRNEIAQKEKFLPLIKEQLPLLKVGAYIEFFRRDIERGSIIQLDNLPYDFFHSIGSGAGPAYEDAKLIKQGLTIKDVSPYKDHGTLIKLLVHLPVVELDNKTWSMYELREASLKNTEPLDKKENLEKLPKILRKYFEEGKSTYDSNERAKQEAISQGKLIDDFSLDDLDSQPEFIKELISSNKEAYISFDKLNKEWTSYLDETFFKDKKSTTYNTLFYAPSSISAHANRSGMIGWNLNVWKDYRIRRFKEDNLEDSRISEFFDVLSHEYAHTIEKTDDMTHNRDFYIKQSQVLAGMIDKKIKDK